MSRSIKKHYFHHWACGRNKPFRQFYNKSKRRKENQLLRQYEISADYPEEQIITRGIDYSVCFSDNWDWPSDGGNYFSGDKSSFRKDFNTTLKDDHKHIRFCMYNPTSLWDRYQEALTSNYDYDFLDMIAHKNLAGKEFTSEEELLEYCLKNQERIIEVYIKLNFGK